MSRLEIFRDKEADEFLERFESRRDSDVSQVETVVANILRDVRQNGDAALIRYSREFDSVDLDHASLRVADQELEAAWEKLPDELKEILAQSRENIKAFHSKGLPQSWLDWQDDGTVLGQRFLAMERVGVYVPGGRAAYPSSMLMGVVPAQVAGVREIIITTPAAQDGTVNQTILAAAHLLGVTAVYRLGGAQAIAAMAYGTDTVPRVDKIVGPGNIYVATAKKMIFGQCGIDSVAGPSEVVVIADDSAEPAFVAADLLAQAEHDPLASAILITESEKLALAVQQDFARQLETLGRKSIIEKSASGYGGILVAGSLEQVVAICNRLAPEHLGLHVQSPWDLLPAIKNAGAIFLGSYSPETVGDYWAGPNHILPTNGSARFFSPLRAEDFLKTSSIINFSKEAMLRDGDKIIRFALSEGLDAHANAIQQRVK